MKFLHIADLHLGRRMNGYSLLEDQAWILDQILSMAKAHSVQGVLIAGDVFDKPNPGSEAVHLLDGFLSALAKEGIAVCMISGNHDSGLRLSYGASLFALQNIHIAGLFQDPVQRVEFEDAWGKTTIWMVPFVKPSAVSLQGQTFSEYPAMFEAIVNSMDRKEGRHILLAHQFFAGARTCDSEEISVGTLDNIPPACIQNFDYAALGHIHSPQKAGAAHVRYAGSPLAYSVSEIGRPKSVPLITLEEQVQVELLPLQPLRQVRRLEGYLEDLLDADFVAGQNTRDFVHIVLQDAKEQLQAASRLRQVYENMVRLDYAWSQSESEEEEDLPDTGGLGWLAMMDAFYERQQGTALNQNQRRLIENLWDEVHQCGQSD